MCAAGPVMMDNGQESRRRIPKSTLETAVLAGKFNDIGCMVDHRSIWSTPQVEKLAGQWGEVAWEEGTGKVVGVLNAFDTPAGQLTTALIDAILQEETPTNVGISLDCYGVWEWDEASEFVILTEITHVSSADIVFGPATDSRVRTALSALSSNLGDTDMPKWLRILLDAKAAGGAPPAPTQPDLLAQAAAGVHLEAQQTAVAQQLAEVQKMAQASFAAAAAGLVNASKLPEFEKETLVKSLAQFSTVKQVEDVIKERLDIAAKYAEENTVKMGAGAPRGANISGMKTPMDEAGKIVDFLFGVEKAELPEPQMRHLATFYTAFTGDFNFRGVFNGEHALFAGANTTDLPNLAVNAMNKVIMERWLKLTHWRWYEKIVEVVPNDGTIHNLNLITYGGPATLPTVAEKGAYTELSPGDAKETASFVKKGGYVGITLEMIKNSDILQLQAVPKALALAALKTRSAAVSALFTTASGVGPNLADTNPLFHASGSNVATTALSAAAWAAARAECFKHVGAGDASAIGIFPRFCLVPADLYDTALTIFGYGEGMPTSYNAYAESRPEWADLRPIPLAVPNWTDATDWAYVTSPDEWPVIAMSYAQLPAGRKHATVEVYSAADATTGLMFTNDTMAIKARDWFAAGVNGRAGIGKRNVA